MDQQPPEGVTPNWLLLSLIVASAIALGVLPFLVWFGAAQWAIAVFLIAVIWVSWKGRGFVCAATERPRPLEWILAGWNAVGYGAMAGLMGFIWYGIAWGAFQLVALGANALGWGFAFQPTTIATWIAAAFVTLVVLGMPAIASDELPGKLYPAIAGTRSVFYPLTAAPWRLAAVAAAVVAVLAAGLAFLDWQGLWFALGATLVLVVSGSHLITLKASGRPAPARVTDARELIRKLFATAGYELVEKPRTGSPEVDPLIASVDFLAMSGSRGYAIEIKVPGAPETVIEWSAASTVRTGAKALQRALRAGERPTIVVEPFLIVVGGRLSEDLQAFAREEGVKLAHFGGIDALQTPVAGAGTPARDVALELLDVPGGETMAAPANETSVGSR